MSNTKEIINIFNSGDENALLKILDNSYKIEKGNIKPLDINNEDVSLFSTLLQHYSNQSVLNLHIIKSTLRCMRNSVVLNKTAQDLISTHNLMTYLYEICNKLLEGNDEVGCTKMLLHFFTNLVVNNEKSGEIVYRALNFTKLLDHEASLPLIYNIVLQNKKIKLRFELMTRIFELFHNNNVSGNEYLLLLLEFIIKNELYIKYYHDFSSSNRIILLEGINDLIHDITLGKDFLEKLIDDFKKKSDCILKTVSTYIREIEPYEVSLLLEILSSLSGYEHLLSLFQCDKSLLINCAFLLKSIHCLGKESENYFSALEKLSEVNSPNRVIREHPAFGFKASLIRLLGNLCWKCKENQDELRELECLQLLLDCCNIDARNPLIMQWVIFAVRNLCEKNKENQSVIASLTKRGVVDSAVIKEFGLTLNSNEEGSVNIVPLIKKK